MSAEVNPKAAVTTLRIILVAMMIAVITVPAAFVGLGPTPSSGEESAKILAIVVAVMTVGAAVAAITFRAVIIRRLRTPPSAAIDEQTAGDPVASALFAATLIPAATAEGIGLLGAVGYWITGQGPFLIVSGAAFLVIAALIPTDRSMERFYERHTGPPQFTDDA